MCMYGQVPGSSLGYVSEWTFNFSISVSSSLSLLFLFIYISKLVYLCVYLSLPSISPSFFSLYLFQSLDISFFFSLKSNPSKERPEMNHMDANLGIRIRER